MIRRSQPAAFVLIMCGFLLKNPILITFVAFSLLPFASAKLEMAKEYPVLDDFGPGYETGYSGVPDTFCAVNKTNGTSVWTDGAAPGEQYE